jgi:hypothetical protein
VDAGDHFTDQPPLAIAEARGTGATAIKLYADLSAALVQSITEEPIVSICWLGARGCLPGTAPRRRHAEDVISHACLLGYRLRPAALAYEDRGPWMQQFPG